MFIVFKEDVSCFYDYDGLDYGDLPYPQFGTFVAAFDNEDEAIKFCNKKNLEIREFHIKRVTYINNYRKEHYSEYFYAPYTLSDGSTMTMLYLKPDFNPPQEVEYVHYLYMEISPLYNTYI